MSLQKNRTQAMDELLRTQLQRRNDVQAQLQVLNGMTGCVRVAPAPGPVASQVKLYIEEPEAEIRRFNLEASASYETLRQKVGQLLGRDNFRLFWQDTEGDFIVCESADEFEAARQNTKAPSPLRIYVRASTKRQKTCPKKAHRDVTCDGCDGEVAGTRYKCLECEDFDLCEKCESQGKHEHDMLAIRAPHTKDWKKLFNRGYGAREGSKEHSHRHGGRPTQLQGEVLNTEYVRAGPPHGIGYGGFVPPFIKEVIGAFPPGMGKTVEMDIDMNRPIHDIIADVAKKVADALKPPQAAQQQEQKEPEKVDVPVEKMEVPVEEVIKKVEEVTKAVEVTATVVQDAVEQMTESLKNADLLMDAMETGQESDGEWTQLDGETEVEKTQEFVQQIPDKQVAPPTVAEGRIEAALRAMEEMGFPNEGNLLRRLLVNYNGDISRVLDSIQ